MQTQKPAKPTWLKSLLIAVPLGFLFGLPLPVLLYMSEAKDWGKGDYSSYWDFAWRFWFYGALQVIATIAVVWLISMSGYWLARKAKARQS